MTRAPRAGCARVAGRLEALVDGGLNALDAALDRGHLEACAGCRALRDEHERLLARLPLAWHGGVAREAEALLAAVRHELAGRPETRRPRHRAPPPLVAAAVAAALLVVLRLWLGPGPADRPAGGATVELGPLLERLPSWSDLRAGLGQLSRWVS